MHYLASGRSKASTQIDTEGPGLRAFSRRNQRLAAFITLVAVKVAGVGRGVQWRRLTLTLVILMSICAFVFCQLTEMALSEDLNSAIPDCPKWLAAADSFLDECNTRARYFTRTFFPGGGSRGEKEEHSTWFAPAAGDSHFLMGCTLRVNRSLSFLGLYYTAEPSAIAQANTAPILVIDFDGDVVLSIDGHPVTFTAVQPFDTPRVKTRWSGSHTVALNCQSPLGQDGGYHLMRGNTFIDFHHFDIDNTLAISSFPDPKQRFQYVEFFSSALPRHIIYSWGNQVLVTTSGSILVRADWFPERCHGPFPERIAASSLLLHQLCRILHVK